MVTWPRGVDCVHRQRSRPSWFLTVPVWRVILVGIVTTRLKNLPSSRFIETETLRNMNSDEMSQRFGHEKKCKKKTQIPWWSLRLYLFLEGSCDFFISVLMKNNNRCIDNAALLKVDESPRERVSASVGPAEHFLGLSPPNLLQCGSWRALHSENFC